jgi:hypothetical protein
MALTIRPADIIKAKVIDYLIEKFEGIVIGDEVMYGSSRKVVDLLALYKGETYAIEIKSAKDDLRRLPEQISEYSKIFDHTLVFTTIDHLPTIKKIIKFKTSIFEFGADDTIKGRLLVKRNNVLKSEMLATMNASYIRKRLNISNFKDSDDIRKKAMRYKKEDVHSMLYEYFMEKCSAPYHLFLEERNDKTEVDDLVILSNRLNVE